MPRFPESVKKPTEILKGRGTIGRLYRHARELLALQERISNLVPGDVRVAAFEDGTLHLVTPSSALATRLRYQQRRFIGALEFDGKPVSAVRVSVRPELAERYEPEPGPAPKMSAANASQIAETAKYIEDEALRAAIMRLSTRSEQ